MNKNIKRTIWICYEGQAEKLFFEHLKDYIKIEGKEEKNKKFIPYIFNGFGDFKSFEAKFNKLIRRSDYSKEEKIEIFIFFDYDLGKDSVKIQEYIKSNECLPILSIPNIEGLILNLTHNIYSEAMTKLERKKIKAKFVELFECESHILLKNHPEKVFGKNNSKIEHQRKTNETLDQILKLLES